MPLMHCRLFSKTLQQHTAFMAALPQTGLGERRFPIMYLLHGGTEDSTIWFRETDLEAIAERYGIILLSIDGMSSAYADMRHGGKYFTYLTGEIMQVASVRLPILTGREHTLIGGFSMGGQGALKAAFRRPDLYAACVAMSGARDMVPLYEKWRTIPNGPDMKGVEDALGPIDEIRGSENDLVSLAEQAAAHKEKLPQLYLSCGKNDYAAELSVDYHHLLENLHIPHDFFYEEGVHCYAFGEKALRHALDDMQRRGML